MTQSGIRPGGPADDVDTRVGESDDGGRPLDASESLDSDGLGSTDAGLDPLDDSWDPPDRPSGGLRHGNTRREERDGESLDAYLAQELPDIDPYQEAELQESGAVLDADVYAGTTARSGQRPEDDDLGPIGDIMYDGNDLEGRATAPGRRTANSGEGRLPAEDSTLYVDPAS